MFSQRYDPLAEENNGSRPANSGFGVSLKKRKLSDDESSDEEEEEEETDEFEHESSQDEDINEEEPDEEEEDTNKVDDNMEIDLQPEVDPDYIHKHQTIFNKFKQSTESETIEQEKEEDEEEDANIEQHSLVPLPQPALPRDRKLSSVSTHKNLDWLTKPQYASPLDKRLLQILNYRHL